MGCGASSEKSGGKAPKGFAHIKEVEILGSNFVCSDFVLSISPYLSPSVFDGTTTMIASFNVFFIEIQSTITNNVAKLESSCSNYLKCTLDKRTSPSGVRVYHVDTALQTTCKCVAGFLYRFQFIIFAR